MRAYIDKNPFKRNYPSQGVKVTFSEELTSEQIQRIIDGPYPEGVHVKYANGAFGFAILPASAGAQFEFSFESIKIGLGVIFGPSLEIIESE